MRAIADSSDSPRASNSWIDYALIALLAILAMRVFLKRQESEPPRWMGRVQTATPRFSFLLGFPLFVPRRRDIVTMFSVASYLVDRGAAWWRGLPLVVLTCLLVATPSSSSFSSPRRDPASARARLDERELVGDQRDRDRLLPRDDDQRAGLSRRPFGGRVVGADAVIIRRR